MWALSLVEDYPYNPKGCGLFGLKDSIAKSIVFSKWKKEGVGGNLVCMVSGSAPLAARLNHIFCVMNSNF